MSAPDATRQALPAPWVSVLAVVSSALVAGGWFLPLWRATLHAPQYPGGLTMEAYGRKVTGDVDEISSLNHYVGMRPFDLADFPEIALWPYAIAVAFVAVGLALLVRRRILRILGLVYLWGMPVGVLAVIQLRLHQYGRDLDPGAALRIEPFTPLVVGPTEVWNFMTWSWPGLGLVALLLAALLLTVAPRLSAWRAQVARPLTVALAASVAVVLVPALPASAGAETRPAATDADAETASLADLIGRAGPGQRVVVPAGTYRGPVVIDRPVVIEPRGEVVIAGDGSGTVLTIRAPGTVVRGVTVRGSGTGPTGNPAAIRIEADDVTVERVRVANSYIGIAVEEAASVRLVDNTIMGRPGGAILDEGHAVEHDTDDEPPPDGAHDDGTAVDSDLAHRARGDGIWLHDVEHVLVRGNRIEHARDGVYVSFGSNAIIDGNVVRGSRYAVHSMYARDLTLIENHFTDNLSGAVLMYRGPALVLRNHIEGSRSGSTGFALLLKDVTDVEATQNILVGNRVGVHIDGPAGGEHPLRLAANTVARNTVGVSAYPSAQATFRANSFVDNDIQVLAQGGRLAGLTWSDRGSGNFWSTYRGYEGHPQGYGAIPHVEGGAVDRLLGRNPELLALAGTPALRLLRSVEERWGRQTPVLTDELPITTPVSPPVPQPEDQPARGVARIAAAAVLSAALGFLLVASRRPSPRRFHHAHA